MAKRKVAQRGRAKQPPGAASAGDMRALGVVGNCMAPTLTDGSIISAAVFDGAPEDLDGEVVCINDKKGGTLIRRVYWFPEHGLFLVVSDDLEKHRPCLIRPGDLNVTAVVQDCWTRVCRDKPTAKTPLELRTTPLPESFRPSAVRQAA